jgi:hypothetical protein
LRLALVVVDKLPAVSSGVGGGDQLVQIGRQIVSEVVRGLMDRRAAAARIALWTEENMAADERERFREIAEAELLNLHERNFACYQIRPSEFAAWDAVWKPIW